MADRRGRSPIDTVAVAVVALGALAAGMVSGARRHEDDGEAAEAPLQAGRSGRGPFKPLTGVMGRIDRVSRRRGFGWVAVALRVQQRFGELHGNYLAGAIGMAGFLAIFPLLLVALAIAGFVSHAQGDIAPSLISHLGLNGQAATEITNALHAAERSRRAATVIGLVGLLWSGLGVVGAMQYAYDQVWQVEERGIRDKLYGLAWLAGAVLVFAVSAGATALLAFLPGFLSPVALLVALATNIALLWWTAKILPNRDVGWRPLLPGAILGGVGLEVLKAVGGFYVPRLVSQSSQLYGSIGIVFAILAWLLLVGQLVVYSSVLNVVLWERRHGTVETLVEVPAQPGVGPESTRMGRSEEAHGRAVA